MTTTSPNTGDSVPPPSLEVVARLVNLAEDAIVSADEQHRLVLFNRGAERTFGYAATEVVGQPLNLLLPERFHTPHNGYLKTFAEGELDARTMAERRSVRGRRKDGSEFPAEITISKFHDGGRLFLNAIVRDVTARVQSEEAIRTLNHDLEERVKARSLELAATTQQLWQAAKLATVGELAASIAHELNNPLGIVSLRLEGVLAQTPADDPRVPALRVIESELERMARLITNLLQFSRNAADQLTTIAVPEEITRTVELIEYHLRRRQVGVAYDFAPDLPPVVADRQKLRQLFLNLYTNAADAMPTGGTLTTRVTAGALFAGRPVVVVEISDTGVGIPPEVLPRVMDPFFTTKEEGKGTGLGLAICRRIVNDHKGTIHLESEVGKGTTVRIALPLRRGPGE